MDNDKIITFIIVIIAIIIVIGAWYWERKAAHEIEQKDDLNDVAPEDQVQFLQELACHNWTEAVAWRRILIASVISVFFIWIFFRQKLQFRSIDFITLAIIIVITFTVIDRFRVYHIDRVLCVKATPNSPWFQTDFFR